MVDTENHSVSGWIQELKHGTDQAATRLWDRYFYRLVGLARKRLSGLRTRMEDEEDVALTVFHCLCEGAKAGRLTKMTNRHDLWRLLATITAHKSVDLRRRERRGKRGDRFVRGESVFLNVDSGRGNNGLSQAAIVKPTAESLVEMEDLFQQLVRGLTTDVTKDVARLRMEGYGNTEIAGRLKISVSSVERKLRLIRQKWSQELVQ